jgi:hypothetical protein
LAVYLETSLAANLRMIKFSLGGFPTFWMICVIWVKGRRKGHVMSMAVEEARG